MGDKLPIIFSREEVALRARILRTMCEILIPRKHTKNFFEPLDSVQIQRLLQMNNPNVDFDLHTVEQVLRFGGWTVSTESIEVPCDINMKNFPHLPFNVQALLMDLVTPKTGLELRQISLESPSAVIKYVPRSILLFYATMVFREKGDFVHFKLIKKSKRKIHVDNMYDLYLRYCKVCGLVPAARKKLIAFFNEQGMTTKFSYYNGKSGQKVISGAVVPWTDEDITHSMDLGMGILTLQDHYCLNDGAIFPIEKHETLELYVKGKLASIDEQVRTTQERQASEEKSQTFSGRAVEVREISDSGRKEEDEDTISEGDGKSDELVTQAIEDAIVELDREQDEEILDDGDVSGDGEGSGQYDQEKSGEIDHEAESERMLREKEELNLFEEFKLDVKMSGGCKALFPKGIEIEEAREWVTEWFGDLAASLYTPSLRDKFVEHLLED